MTAAWYPPGRLVTDGKVTSVTMLASNSGLHHPMWLEKGQHLRLLGLYGRDLGLSWFDTVILTAKGFWDCGAPPLGTELNRAKTPRSTSEGRVFGQEQE